MRASGVSRIGVAVLIAAIVGCASSKRPPKSTGVPDTTAIYNTAAALAADSMRGRGPWSAESEKAARWLADRLTALGAKPVVGASLLVPFVAAPQTNPTARMTAHNVVGVLPARKGRIDGPRIGITAHFDHLGVGEADSRGDAIYNGFLDDAIGVAMVLDVARRYVDDPGDKPLVVAFFNLEEEGLLGSLALARSGPAPLGDLKLLVGVDAGAPAGEALTWQLMGAGTPSSPHAYAKLADSLARGRGWTTTFTPPRPISDVFPFSEMGVPVLFPIPGTKWRGYTDSERTAAMTKFDHYHQPDDEPRRDFPLTGTWHFADWLWQIVSVASR